MRPLNKRFAEMDGVKVKVQKTQTFGLGYHLESLRIDAASEPYPNRWTHHVLISEEKEIDEELMGWIKEAGAFALGKR